MTQENGFNWDVVSTRLRTIADGNDRPQDSEPWLNSGQRASLLAIASRIKNNGLIVADEVGMGKTRIAVALAKAVVECGGRVAILVPPGLGYQWREELGVGGIREVEPVVRSIRGYFEAWADEEQPRPWFDQNTLLISHAFANWRLGSKSEAWRWELLPEVYAKWRQEREGRAPRQYWRRYYSRLSKIDYWLDRAGDSIVGHAQADKHLSRIIKRRILPGFRWGNEAFYGHNFEQGADYRDLLETAVGLGLGVFDLVIIDEAHKSRGEDSALSRLLENVIISHGGTRRVGMSATPVELNASQWRQSLQRILNCNEKGDSIGKVAESYVTAVKEISNKWMTDDAACTRFTEAAKAYQTVLSPYLLRRDKRDEPITREFVENTGLPLNAYRRETEVAINPLDLPSHWRMAVCAAEALSATARGTDDMTTKRLRLNFANAQSIASVLGSPFRQDTDDEAEDLEEDRGKPDANLDAELGKKAERIAFWHQALLRPNNGGEHPLFNHPAILRAVEAIESATDAGEKVLVFGKFIAPMRALVQLLNARRMLKSLATGSYWPESRLRTMPSYRGDQDDWPAVGAAVRQLGSTIPSFAPGSAEETTRHCLNELLQKQYREKQSMIAGLRREFMNKIERGLNESNLRRDNKSNLHKEKQLFNALKCENESNTAAGTGNRANTSDLLWHAISPLLELDQTEPDTGYANAFVDVVNALSDIDQMNNDGDSERDNEEIEHSLGTLLSRLREEFAGPQGRFARLMYGGTRQSTRRLLQLAFNRKSSQPSVLVAQSQVGREGLNLHLACRTVLLLHPEWNPGVVEQQIGRIDRLGSHWAHLFSKWSDDDRRPETLPYIEVWPVVFKGTYDEYNWKVLRERWRHLRAQLHGEVIPMDDLRKHPDYSDKARDLNAVAPNFSPSRIDPTGKSQSTP